jgi:hypothetical protein
MSRSSLFQFSGAILAVTAALSLVTSASGDEPWAVMKPAETISTTPNTEVTPVASTLGGASATPRTDGQPADSAAIKRDLESAGFAVSEVKVTPAGSSSAKPATAKVTVPGCKDKPQTYALVQVSVGSYGLALNLGTSTQKIIPVSGSTSAKQLCTASR